MRYSTTLSMAVFLLYIGTTALAAPIGSHSSVEIVKRGPTDPKPLHDRVIVKRLSKESKTAGGIVIPDTKKEKPAQGEIIRVGGKQDDKSKKSGKR